MRLFIVIDESRFFHPEFLADFLRRTPDEVVGAALIRQIPPRNNVDRWLKRHWYWVRVSEAVRLLLRRVLFVAKDCLLPKSREGGFYSVRSVFRCFKIPFFVVDEDINKPEYLSQIQQAVPDVIISSGSLIFKESLLRIPRVCCVNRHSSLLPSYAGLWPVFQAVRSGEQVTGVSIHTMERKVDAGVVLAQREIPIPENKSLYELYAECFRLSVGALLEALEKLRAGRLEGIGGSRKASYFSFPTSEQWRDFRRKGWRLV